MRNLDTINAKREVELEIQRAGARGDSGNGFFSMPSPVDGYWLRIIASSGGGWEHVSVSLPHRCPTWEEMEAVKREFFEPHETAVQFHVPPIEHVNAHPYCLHLWRPQYGDIPRPPSWMVG